MNDYQILTLLLGVLTVTIMFLGYRLQKKSGSKTEPPPADAFSFANSEKPPIQSEKPRAIATDYVRLNAFKIDRVQHVEIENISRETIHELTLYLADKEAFDDRIFDGELVTLSPTSTVSVVGIQTHASGPSIVGSLSFRTESGDLFNHDFRLSWG